MATFDEILTFMQLRDKIPLCYLDESLQLNVVKFGTDMMNKKWEIYLDPDNNKHNYTFFYFHGNCYVVLVGVDGHVKFNVVDDDTPLKDWNEDKWFKFTQYNKTETKNVFMLFGSIFYVISKAIDDLNINTLYFSGRNAKLKSVYQRMVNDGYLMQYLKKCNFTYEGKDQDTHIFRRIE